MSLLRAARDGSDRPVAGVASRPPLDPPARTLTSRHDAVVWGSVLVACTLAAVAWVVVGPPFSDSAPPVRIESVERVVAGGRIEVEIAVGNTSSGPQRVRAWWILADEGRGPAWPRRAYQSAVQTHELAPGSRLRLRWDEPALVPARAYDLSAWLHVEGRAGFSHADGEQAGTIVVGDEPLLLRGRPPRTPLAIAGATVTVTGEGPGELRATVVLDNAGPDPARGVLSWRLLEAGDRPDPAWWQHEPVFRGSGLPVTVAPGTQTGVTVGGRVTVPPGRYLVHLVLDPVTGGTDLPLDDVAVAEPVALSPGGRR